MHFVAPLHPRMETGQTQKQYFPLLIKTVSNPLVSNSIITHHIDGIHWADAVDKHVCVDHCRFDCKEEEETVLESSNNIHKLCMKVHFTFVYVITIMKRKRKVVSPVVNV